MGARLIETLSSHKRAAGSKPAARLLSALFCALTLAACGQSGSSGTQTASTAPSHTAPALTIAAGGATRQFTGPELLARADAANITIAHDPAYGGRPMNYRAVPLHALLTALPSDSADTIEFRATDGFTAQLPRALIDGAAKPWIAVEDPAHPWPNLPQKNVSAGPFYLVWQETGRARISPEQWPYEIAAMTAVASPAQRWPALAVEASANASARRGQAVFFANCLTCHRLAGAGEGDVGPDLLRPMPATSYYTEAGLRALIRNPAAVRTWPQQHMPAFNAETISDSDINAIIAYLHYLERSRGPASP